MVVENAVVRLSISRFIPEIFAIKVKSSPKLRQFGRPEILRVQAAKKFVPKFSSLPRGTHCGQVW